MSLSCLGWFTYYYLGYLLGNKIIALKIPANCLAPALAGAVLIQILEGYWYYRMGVGNCGTQLKLSAILTGALFVLLAYRFIYNGKNHTCGLLKLLGDHSFGIFFSHIAVMGVLAYIPFYNALIRYPLNAVLTLAVDMCCIYVGGKILGKYREYLAL